MFALRRALAQQLLPNVVSRAAPAAQHAAGVLGAAYSASASGNTQRPWSASSWLWAGAFAAAGAYSSAAGVAHADAPAPPQQAAAPAADPYVLPPASGRLPSKITLYQYEVCPFCCKVKAFLDFHKLPYATIEVNPLTKGELSWSSYRKVPVVLLDDEVVVDSSAIISRLAAEVAAGAGSSSGSGKKGWLGKGRGGPAAPASAEEEARWRRWVDERFVKVLTANIYRSWDEAWGTFRYMTQQSHWSWPVQQSVRLAGSVLMWGIGQRMPRKYNITGDLRQALYADADAFIAAVGPRQFLGGDAPNLADLAVFGVLQAIRGTDTYNDVVLHSSIGPWLSRMVQAVGESTEVKQLPQ